MEEEDIRAGDLFLPSVMQRRSIMNPFSLSGSKVLSGVNHVDYIWRWQGHTCKR